MAEPINSVLLVDFDSVHRSLIAGGGEAAARLVTRAPGWLNGLQSGRLLGPDPRTLTVKRCYADPKVIGEGRGGMTTAGFEIIDVPAAPHGRPVDLITALDAMEHLHDEPVVGEFIILSAEPTLGPLLTRLKQQERRTTIYADTATGQPYRALADKVLEIAAFAEFLLTHDAVESSMAQAVERSEIEAFARKIHAATSIPLFSPRTFAELFRLLTEEIIANGYHFQTTAKNVADRLSDSGRSVTRRQVVFIVKGLALKGHVFSTTDTPRKLAEVFREQARYLIENAGLKVDETQERVLSAWLVDRVPSTIARPAPMPMPPPTPPSAAPRAAVSFNGARAVQPAAASPPATARPAPATKPEVTRAPPVTIRPAERALLERSDKTVPQAEKPAPVGAREPAAERATAADRADVASPAAMLPARAEPRAVGSMITPDDARAAIAAKIAQSVRPRAGARSAARPALAPPPPPPPAAPSEDPAEAIALEGAESIENSILAAIAQAVDVLVEDDESKGEAAATPVEPPATRRRSPAPAAGLLARTTRATLSKPATEPRPRVEPKRQESDDIGDEIQRIIATYNRNRKDEPPA